MLIGVWGFVVSLGPPRDEETEGEGGIEVCRTGGAGSGGWGSSAGGLVVELIAEVIVERKPLLLSFLPFLPPVDSGRGEPATVLFP